MAVSEELQLVSFQIIASVGAARSCYIQAIDLADQGKFEDAQKLIEEGEREFKAGHDAHFGLVQKEAAGESSEFALILMHAEDQLMSAESFGILARKFVNVYKKMEGSNNA